MRFPLSPRSPRFPYTTLFRSAISKNPRLAQSDARIVLIEAMGRIMPEVSEEQAVEVVEAFRARGIEVLLNTSLSSAVDNHLKLMNMTDKSDAGSFYADTLVWTDRKSVG